MTWFVPGAMVHKAYVVLRTNYGLLPVVGSSLSQWLTHLIWVFSVSMARSSSMGLLLWDGLLLAYGSSLLNWFACESDSLNSYGSSR